MNCDCITKVDDKLAERNMELDKTFLLSNSGGVTLSISTHWKNGRKVRGQKPTTLIVNFCPFCGKSTEDKGDKA